MAMLEIRNVQKTFRTYAKPGLFHRPGARKVASELPVLRGVDLTVEKGDVVAILGPSGSGKTTLLRCLNFLETADAGQLVFDGESFDLAHASRTDIARLRKKTAFVFQNYHLFRNKTALQNVTEGLIVARKLPKEQADAIGMKMLAKVGLADRADYYPRQLSGGQQQRVAIARTLAPEPSVLFMDEPLSNLDAKLRLEMRYELQRLHVETGSTFVYVTHDQMEAMTLATQICLMNNGVLQQYAAPLEVYNHPANLFAADFVGNPSINFVEAKGWQRPEGSIELTLLDGHKAVFTPEQPLQLPQWFHRRDEELEAQAQALKARAGESGYVEKSNKDETFRYHIARVNDEDDGIHEEPMLTNEDLVLGIRPEFLSITGGGNVECEIYGAMPTGMESTVKVRIGEYLLTGVVFGSTLFTIGSKHLLDITGSSVMLFDRSSGRRITSGTLKLL